MNSVVIYNNNTDLHGWGGCQCNHCVDDELYFSRSMDEEEGDEEEFEEEEEEFTRPIKKRSLYVSKPKQVSAQLQLINAVKFNAVSMANIRANEEAEINRITKLKKQEEVAKHDALMASLPKFSTVMIAKMTADKAQLVKEKQAKIKEQKLNRSTTKHGAKGRRDQPVQMSTKGFCSVHTSVQLRFPEKWDRGKFVRSARIVQCDQCKSIVASRRKQRQETNASKSMIEQTARTVRMEELDAILQLKKAEDLTAIKQLKELEQESILENETDLDTIKRIRREEYDLFQKNEIKKFSDMVVNKVDDGRLALPLCQVVTEQEPTQGKWTTVGNKPIDKLSSTILRTMFATSSVPVCGFIKGGPAVFKPQAHVANKPHIMCRSITMNKKCFRKPGTCTYAHTAAELFPRTCGNKRCKAVRFTGGVYVNADRSNKTCCYLHEGESKNNLCVRNKIKLPVVKKVAAKTSGRVISCAATGTIERELKPYSASRAWGPAK